MKFNHVFTSERVRRFEETNEGLIEGLAGIRIDKALQAQEIGCWIVGFGPDEGAQNLERIRTADSDNADTTAAGRSGQGNNSINRSVHSLKGYDGAEEGEKLLGGSLSQTDSQPAPITLADGFRDQILFSREREMDNAAFAWLHGTKNK